VDLSVADADLLITVGDLTNAVENLTLQGTFQPFSRLLSMFLKAPFYVFAGIFHNKSSSPHARNNMRDTGGVSRIYFFSCTKLMVIAVVHLTRPTDGQPSCSLLSLRS
jgi:hypothetical protein